MKKIIQMDTREKRGHKDHILRAFQRHGIQHIRSKMYVGDYTLLNDQSTCIDVKQGLQEVYSNLIHAHERFRAECIRAQRAEIRLIILVEEPGISSLEGVKGWENPRIAEYDELCEKVKAGLLPRDQKPKGPPIDSKRLSRIMRTMSELYGIEWRFCSPEQTGDEIIRLLEEGKL